MSQPETLTMNLAAERRWHVVARCDHCRTARMLGLKVERARFGDRDLRDALDRGKLTCSRCDRPCSEITVDKMMERGGILVRVMTLRPGVVEIAEPNP